MNELIERVGAAAVITGLCIVAAAGCSEKAVPRDTNLLKNGSFEKVDAGLPESWEINNFRGLSNMKAATYGIDDTLAYDGTRSFHFEADGDTRRFFMLSQEVAVKGARRVRVKLARKTIGLAAAGRQYPQANVALTYYRKDHSRFMSARFADVRTTLTLGTSDGWVVDDRVFLLPEGTEYVAVHCVLGMSGEIWFDDISLSIPTDLPWREKTGNPFVHHWLPERKYPENSIEFQQQLFEHYAARLGISREAWRRIDYYLYPDSAMMYHVLGTKKPVKVDYVRREIHSIDPVDDHEIVHLLTDPYGRLPRILGEGTAHYLLDDVDGKPVQPQAQELLRAGKIGPLGDYLDPVRSRFAEASVALPACASFVGFLLEFGGPEKFLELHRQADLVGSASAFPVAFEKAYGGSFAEAEAVWRRKLANADFSKAKRFGKPKREN